MHIHILGIAGVFMSGIAVIAKQLGYKVSGVDAGIYAPMSEQLSANNIDYNEGYTSANLPNADLFIIGNALSRGNACVEYILDNNLPYTSGPQWLGENVLKNKWVLAIAGTHGKTTTTAMLVHILERAGLNPSYLVGGVMNDFARCARLTNSEFFVIEADEYDSAFFDKRSKFIHYRPKTLVINNLEFDHADIFDSLADIQKQFAHLLRIIPSNGLIIYPQNSPSIQTVIDKGCWSKTKTINTPLVNTNNNGSSFVVNNKLSLSWQLLGKHNAHNAISALTAAKHIDISLEVSIAALQQFKNIKRRLETIYNSGNITIYDDFAHHPTAISATISALRNKVGATHITAVVELGSNTMSRGIHTTNLIDAFSNADRAYIYSKNNDTSAKLTALIGNKPIEIFNNINDIIEQCLMVKKQHIIIMSNRNFDGIHQKLIDKLV